MGTEAMLSRAVKLEMAKNVAIMLPFMTIIRY